MPGEAAEVELGGGGATLSGRVVATGRNNDAFSKSWSLNYLIRRDAALPLPTDAAPLSFDPSGLLNLDWTSRPDFGMWRSLHQNHYVKLSEEGDFRIHGVEPGEYELLIQLYEQPAGCLVETVGQKVVSLTIDADQVAKGEVDVGTVEVPCRIGPRVGSDMRAYQFTDADGALRHVDDLRGRHVLLHVWASWCGPCLASMPNLKAEFGRYPQEQLTAVGLNVDADRERAEEVAEAEGMEWAQNYLGLDSDLMRQLAVSSVPAYYLIGPDGKLVGSANQWEEIADLLEKRIGE